MKTVTSVKMITCENISVKLSLICLSAKKKKKDIALFDLTKKDCVVYEKRTVLLKTLLKSGAIMLKNHLRHIHKIWPLHSAKTHFSWHTLQQRFTSAPKTLQASSVHLVSFVAWDCNVNDFHISWWKFKSGANYIKRSFPSTQINISHCRRAYV